jgi:ligand-binding sensor domain-containing protein
MATRHPGVRPFGASLLLASACVFLLSSPQTVSALDPARSLAQYHHTAWTFKDGMPPNTFAIAQTPDGFLWLGSTTGLYRFDGVRA